MGRPRLTRCQSDLKDCLMARLARLRRSDPALRLFVTTAAASSIALAMLVFSTTASAASSADDDILDYIRPLILSRPLPQGVTFSNFAGEVFEDSQSDEPANQQTGAGWLRNKSAAWPLVDSSSGSSCGVPNWDGNTPGYDPNQDVLVAHSQGQEFLVDLAYTAPCAFSNLCQTTYGKRNPVCQYYAPEPLSDWTAYVTAAVAQYSVPPFNVKYFQIWNEPVPQEFWRILDGGNASQEFVDNIYNPAAPIIHASGGQVVFAGWPCDIGNSNWHQCENDLNALLNYHSAWLNTDYIDVHYAPLWVWQDLYQTWVLSGKVKGLWQSEIGGTFSQGPLPGALPPTYLTAMYWALSSGGGRKQS
jgi:hypothetical protein